MSRTSDVRFPSKPKIFYLVSFKWGINKKVNKNENNKNNTNNNSNNKNNNSSSNFLVFGRWQQTRIYFETYVKVFAASAESFERPIEEVHRGRRKRAATKISLPCHWWIMIKQLVADVKAGLGTLFLLPISHRLAFMTGSNQVDCNHILLLPTIK